MSIRQKQEAQRKRHNIIIAVVAICCILTSWAVSAESSTTPTSPAGTPGTPVPTSPTVSPGTTTPTDPTGTRPTTTPTVPPVETGGTLSPDSTGTDGDGAGVFDKLFSADLFGWLEDIFGGVSDISDLVEDLVKILNPKTWVDLIVGALMNLIVQGVLRVAENMYNAVTTTATISFFSHDFVTETLSFFRWVAGLILAAGLLLSLAKQAEHRMHGDGGGFQDLILSTVMGYGLLLFCEPVVLFLNDRTIKLATQLSNISYKASWSLLWQNSGSAFGADLMSVIVCIGILVVSAMMLWRALKRFGVLYIQIFMGYLYIFDVIRGNRNAIGEWGRDVLGGCLTYVFQVMLYRVGMSLVAITIGGGVTALLSASGLVGLAFLVIAGTSGTILKRWGYTNQVAGKGTQVASMAMSAARLLIV